MTGQKFIANTKHNKSMEVFAQLLNIGPSMRFWYVPHMSLVIPQTNLCIFTDLPEPSLLAQIKLGGGSPYIPNTRSLTDCKAMHALPITTAADDKF